MQTDEAHQRLENVNQVIVGIAYRDALRPIWEEEDEFHSACTRRRGCPECEMRPPLRSCDDARGTVAHSGLRKARSLVFRRDRGIVQRSD